DAGGRPRRRHTNLSPARHCARFSLSLQNSNHYVMGRKTLGSTGDCEIDLLISAGNIRFGASGWTATMPHILIFDGKWDRLFARLPRACGRDAHHRPGFATEIRLNNLEVRRRHLALLTTLHVKTELLALIQ